MLLKQRPSSMKRESSDVSNGSSKGQQTLLSFLKAPAPARIESPSPLTPSQPTIATLKRKAVRTIEVLSSDDDEPGLLNTEPLLVRSTRSIEPSTATVPKRTVRHSSPPLMMPSFSGTFSLEALLTDRAERLEEKATIKRVEGPSINVEPSGRGNQLSEKVERLLKAENGESRLFWSSVRTPCEPSNVQTDVPIPQALLKVLPKTEASIMDVEGVCDCLEMFAITITDDIYTYLITQLTSTRNVSTVLHIGRVMAKFTSVLSGDISRMLADIASVPDICTTQGRSALPSSESAYLTIIQPADVAPLTVAKLVCILNILKVRLVGTASKDFDQQSLVQWLVVLYLDVAYGPRLYSEIQSVMTQIVTGMDCMDFIRAFECLDFVQNCEFQLQILECLPANTKDNIMKVQALSMKYFLRLEDVHDHDLQFEQSIPKTIIRLTSAAPFHPLDNSTSYAHLIKEIALLSHATMSVPPQHSRLTLQLIDTLRAMHGRIVDSKAAFIVRSEAKAAIQRLSDRLKYTLEAQKGKTGVFDGFKK